MSLRFYRGLSSRHLPLIILMLISLLVIAGVSTTLITRQHQLHEATSTEHSSATDNISLMNGTTPGSICISNCNSHEASSTSKQSISSNTYAPSAQQASSTNSTTAAPPSTDETMAGSVAPSPSVDASKSTTLPGCTYGNGPHSGEHCPTTPPPSWSYSAQYTCTNSGVAVPCASYEDTTLISGYHYNNADYCQFFFSAGYKIVKVYDYHRSSDVDCATAFAI